MPITKRNFYEHLKEEGMKFKKYKTQAWIKKIDFEKDEYRHEKTEKEGKVSYNNFVSTEEMKSLCTKRGDKDFGKNCNDRDVWLTEKEREHNLKEAYKINLRRQRKHGKRRDVDDKE